MLPVVRGEQYTRLAMLIYALVLVPLTLMPVAWGAFGWLYAVAAGLLDVVFLWYCVRLWTPGGTGAAWKLYRYSLVYLFLLCRHADRPPDWASLDSSAERHDAPHEAHR